MPHTVVDISADGIANLTIRGARSLNIIGSEAIVAASATLEQLAARADVRVLVLRGADEESFIGGADIDEMAALDPQSAVAFITRLKDLCEAVRRFPTPVIARLAGWTLGGGLELAAACDLRIAAEDARFGMPEVAVGIPSVIHAALLPRLVGTARATWLVMTAQPIDARTAHEWGLVHEVHAPATLDARIAALATRLAGFGHDVMRRQKRLLREWESLTADEAIDRSVAEFGAAYQSGEPQRYMGDFIARRRQAR